MDLDKKLLNIKFSGKSSSFPPPPPLKPLNLNGKEKNIKNKIKAGCIKLMMWNKGNSLFDKKKDEIELLLSNHKPMCLGIMEANVEPDHHLPALEIDGYKLELDGLWHSGAKARTVIYIMNEASYVRRKDLEPPDSPAIWLEFWPASKKACLVFVAYREWRKLKAKSKRVSGSDKQQLKRLDGWEESWLKANEEGKQMILMGDFNVDVRPWTHPLEELTAYQSSKKHMLSKLREMCSVINVDIMKTNSTRSQGQSCASILDVVFSNCISLLTNPILIPSSTDHKIVMFSKKGKPFDIKPVCVTARSFKKYNKHEMMRLLNVTEINKLLWEKDTNYVANNLILQINGALDVIAPIKKIQIRRSYAPSLSEHTKNLMLVRDAARETFSKSKSETDCKTYKKLRNSVLAHQRKDKKEWASKMLLADGNNARNIWRSVKTISGNSKRTTINKITLNGIGTTNVKDIANGLNSAFIEKVAKLKEQMPHPKKDLLNELMNTPTPLLPELQPLEITEIVLNSYIKKMKKTTSAGSDTINAVVLADIYPVIKRTLLHLINLSICSGVFPEIFKETKIIPLLKSGKDPTSPLSYRPVSNTCSIGKLIERCCFDQMMNHINSLGLMNKNHHGGIARHSTSTCVTQILDDAKTALENNKKVAIMAIDLSSAYDLVNHKILIEKCRLLNVGQVGLNWLKDFLDKRSQFVDINGTRSATLPNGDDGVVQGGPSSGELFVIFVNSLPISATEMCEDTKEKAGETTSNMFIDDLSSVSSADSEEELNTCIKKEFQRIEDYLVSLKMKINVDKTQLMYISPTTTQKIAKISLNGADILHQEHLKILGINLSSDLKFDHHLRTGSNNMIKSINSKMSLLRAVKPYIPTKDLALVGNNLINSTINYGAVIWGTTSKANKDAIQKSQVRAARLILNQSWYDKKKATGK